MNMKSDRCKLTVFCTLSLSETDESTNLMEKDGSCKMGTESCKPEGTTRRLKRREWHRAAPMGWNVTSRESIEPDTGFTADPVKYLQSHTELPPILHYKVRLQSIIFTGTRLFNRLQITSSEPLFSNRNRNQKCPITDYIFEYIHSSPTSILRY